MEIQRQNKQFRYFNDSLNSLITFAKKVTLPGFDNMPLYEVGAFFLKGMLRGSLTTRASSIAFNMFLAIFPAIIFLVTLMPHLPIENFDKQLLALLNGMMPHKAYLAIEGAVQDIFNRPRGGLLSFGFVAALYFSTNGISAMIGAFNATYLTLDTRSWWNQKLISILIVLILFVLVTIAVILIAFGSAALDWLVAKGWLEMNITFYLLTIGRWVVIVALFFFALSILFYMAPAKKDKWRFISAGATLATGMIIITSLVFSYYVNNFDNYNKLYGSIGTLISVLLWMYFNSLSLLIGFELNTSINNAQLKQSELAGRNAITS